jgi:hypothetical protein
MCPQCGERVFHRVSRVPAALNGRIQERYTLMACEWTEEAGGIADIHVAILQLYGTNGGP